MTQEDRDTFAELGESAYNEDGSLNRDVVPADILAKFDADEQAYANWEAALQSAQSFALETAVKSTHPQANTGMPIAPMIPYGEALKLSWEFHGTLTLMSDNATYPDVSSVVPTVKAVEGFNIYQDIIDNWQDVPELLPEGGK
ncbi:MAG: YdeI/OmpD-associated family protein [Treponema sp.]|nr:YdeI/OmpD-associated family protein [Treponema sp.]